MDERGTIYSRVLDCDAIPGQDGHQEQGSLNAVIDFLIGAREVIPQQFRAVAWCQIRGDSEYGDAWISVGYERPETDEEMAARIEVERLDAIARRNAKEAQERATYEALKRKFEGGE